MKKKTKLIAGAMLAIAMSASVGVGATFALFTSESQVNIAVTSAKVSVKANIDKENTQSKQLKKEYAAGATNTYAGDVEITDESVTIKKFAPGDGLMIPVAFTNNSTIDILYRVRLYVEGDANLAKALDISFDEFDGVYDYDEKGNLIAYSNTKEGKKLAEEKLSVKVEMPAALKGEEYQEKNVKIFVTVEAVQGNGELAEIPAGFQAPQAELNGRKYLSVQAAVRDAKDGDVILVPEDIELEERIMFNKPGKYTLKIDSKITFTKQVLPGIRIDGEGVELTIETTENTVVEATAQGEPDNKGNIYGGMPVSAFNGAKVTINGEGTFIGGEGYSAVFARTGAIATINGGYYKTGIYRGDHCVLNIGDNETPSAQMIVKGGTFEDYNPAWGDQAMDKDTYGQDLSFEGKFIAEGYIAQKIEKDGHKLYTVVAAVKVSDGDELANAIAEGKAAVLQNDMELTQVLTLEAGQNAVVDLNGKTLNFAPVARGINDRPFYISAGSSLTVYGGESGTMTCTQSQVWGLFDNYGELNIFGGSYETNGDHGGAIVRGREGAKTYLEGGRFVCTGYDGAVVDDGDTVIEGGYFYTESSNGNPVNAGYWSYCVNNRAGKLHIKDAEVYGIQGGIAACGAETIVENCKVHVGDIANQGKLTKSFYALYVNGNHEEAYCLVKGGTYIADYRSAVYSNNPNQGDGGECLYEALEIYGGTFIGGSGNGVGTEGLCFTEDDGGKVTLYGGTFNSDVSEWVDEGYWVEKTETEEGVRYTVKEREVVEVADESALREALENIQNGQMIKITQSMELGSAINFTKPGDYVLSLDAKLTFTEGGHFGIVARGEGVKLTINGTENAEVNTFLISAADIEAGKPASDRINHMAQAIAAFDGAEITVNGGTYVGGIYGAALYCNDGKITVLDGTFSNGEYNAEHTVLNARDTMPNGIFVYGGTFIDTNPAWGDYAKDKKFPVWDKAVEGYVEEETPTTTGGFVVEGYEVQHESGSNVWTVVKAN